MVGNGVVVHLPTLFEEIETLESQGIEIGNRLLISDRAHLLFDLHKEIDGLREAELAGATHPTSLSPSNSPLLFASYFEWCCFQSHLSLLCIHLLALHARSAESSDAIRLLHDTTWQYQDAHREQSLSVASAHMASAWDLCCLHFKSTKRK